MAKKKKAGRPAMSAKEKRFARFVVKLNDEEFRRIKMAVGKGKLTTWARVMLLKATEF